MKNPLTILLCLPLFVLGQSVTIPNTVIPYATNPDFVTPGRGVNTFYTNTEAINVPDPAVAAQSGNNETRFNWGDLQTGPGVYTWGNLDAQLNTSIGRRQTFRLRIIGTANGNPGVISVGGGLCAYPLFVHNLMQAESVKDWIPPGTGNQWVPNWNSNNWLSNVETFLLALRDHINNTSFNGVPYKNVLRSLDIGFFGNYAEWHTYPWRDCGCAPAGTIATAASLIRMINAHATAFPNIPLLGNVDMFSSEIPGEVGYYILTQGNTWGPFGLRGDHMGIKDTYSGETSDPRSFNGLVFAQQSVQQYKVAPFAGEPMNSASQVTAGGTTPFWHLEAEVRGYHYSDFNNQNGTGLSNTLQTLADNYRAASKATGYRLQYAAGGTTPDSLRPNTVFPIRMIWQNVGVAPLYYKYNVVYEFRQAGVVKLSFTSAFDPRLFLPGTLTVTDNYAVPSLPAGGSYDLYVIFRDALNYTIPIVLANTGKQSDGSYLIRSGIRVGVNGSAPPPPPPPPPNIPPSAFAGPDISDTLPVTTDTLRGIVSDVNGDALTLSWIQLAGGPNTATMGSPTLADNILTNLVKGVYQFRLTANDGHGGITSDDVKVTMNDGPVVDTTHPTPIYEPPTVTMRGDTLVQFTADSAYLVAVITDTSLTAAHDTTIASVLWSLYSYSGTTVGTIVSASSSTTKVTGLTPGIYQYRFKVIDKAGNEVIADGFRRVIVLPVIVPDPLPLPGPRGATKVFGIKKS